MQFCMAKIVPRSRRGTQTRRCVPPPGEPTYRQSLRRISWSPIAIIAPEIVALNPWMQYRAAKYMTKTVNTQRHTRLSSRASRQRCLSLLSVIFLAVFGIPDRLRMFFPHRPESLVNEQEKIRSRKNNFHAQLREDKLPWTMDVAFYAVGGGCVTRSRHGVGETLSHEGIVYEAMHHPKNLLPVQEAILQDPSKASGLVKLITCIQVLWFCSQCATRLAQNMAVSLIELNTFAHCVSALFIYAFWWHKPYEVGRPVYIDNSELHQASLFRLAIKGVTGSTRRMSTVLFVAPDTHGHPVNIFALHPGSIPAIQRPPNSSCSSGSKGEAIPGTDITLDQAEDGWEIPCMSKENKLVSGTEVFSVSSHSLTLWKQLWHVWLESRSPVRSDRIWSGNHALFFTIARAENSVDSLLGWIWKERPTGPLALIFTFLMYGGLYLLVWQ